MGFWKIFQVMGVTWGTLGAERQLHDGTCSDPLHWTGPGSTNRDCPLKVTRFWWDWNRGNLTWDDLRQCSSFSLDCVFLAPIRWNNRTHVWVQVQEHRIRAHGSMNAWGSLLPVSLPTWLNRLPMNWTTNSPIVGRIQHAQHIVLQNTK